MGHTDSCANLSTIRCIRTSVQTPRQQGAHWHLYQPLHYQVHTDNWTYPLTIRYTLTPVPTFALPSAGFRGAPPARAPYGPKFSRIHAVFQKIWQNRMLAPQRVGAPSYRESWIRPCYQVHTDYCINLWTLHYNQPLKTDNFTNLFCTTR